MNSRVGCSEIGRLTAPRKRDGFERLLDPAQIVLDRSVTEHGPGIGTKKRAAAKASG